MINLFPNRIECSCGYTIDVRKSDKVSKLAWKHGRRNAPAVAINRDGCSNQCIEERMVRSLINGTHDFDCPNYKNRNKDGS